MHTLLPLPPHVTRIHFDFALRCVGCTLRCVYVVVYVVAFCTAVDLRYVTFTFCTRLLHVVALHCVRTIPFSGCCATLRCTRTLPLHWVTPALIAFTRFYRAPLVHALPFTFLGPTSVYSSRLRLRFYHTISSFCTHAYRTAAHCTRFAAYHVRLTPPFTFNGLPLPLFCV